MNWLRSTLRNWLGLDGCITVSEFEAYRDSQQKLLAALQLQLTEFKKALKKRAAVPVRVVPRYTDFESAQVAQLDEFKEKN